jgi:type II secretory pathway component PulM
MKAKLERVEAKVVQKFWKSLTPREKELLATKVPELNARDRDRGDRDRGA